MNTSKTDITVAADASDAKRGSSVGPIERLYKCAQCVHTHTKCHPVPIMWVLLLLGASVQDCQSGHVT